MYTIVDEHGDMKNDAVNQANIALEQFSEEKEIAKHIKVIVCIYMQESYLIFFV